MEPAGDPVAAGVAPVAAGLSPVVAEASPASSDVPADRGADVDAAKGAAVPASAGVPSQPLVAAVKPRRATVLNSAGIRCENIASDGTTTMQLNNSRARSFMAAFLAMLAGGV